MRLLYFTDTHIRGSNPRSRVDNFNNTLKNKFNEITEICVEEKIDHVLFGGDLFDRPDISLSVVKDYIPYLKKLPLPIYSIAGNHDVFGQNPGTINRTILGILEAAGILKILGSDEKVYFSDQDIRVQLTGCSYFYDLDRDEGRKGYYASKEECSYAVHMVHGLLLDKPFMEGIPHTVIDDIVDKTNADITICGHYHSGYGIKKIGDKYFINPGSVARVSNTASEVARIPSCLIISFEDGIKASMRPLKTALPGDRVLDRETIRKEEFKEQKLNQFIQQVNSYGSFEVLNIEKIINEIAEKGNIPEEIKKEAIRRISESQLLLSGRDVVE